MNNSSQPHQDSQLQRATFFSLVITALLVLLGASILAWEYGWIPAKQARFISEQESPAIRSINGSDDNYTEKANEEESFTEENEERIKIDLSECEKIEDDSGRNKCIYDIAIASEDLKLCESVQEIPFLSKDVCLSGIAYRTSNITVCTKLEELIGIGYLCFGRIAVLEQDPEICYAITKQVYRDSCFKDIGATLSNLDDCDKIENRYTKEDCYDQIVEDIAFCENVELDKKDTCFLVIARREQDENICKRISENAEEDWCFLVVATRKVDKNICNRISDSELQQRCKGFIEGHLKF